MRSYFQGHRTADLICCTLAGCASILVAVSFFGNYAIDDSFVGYVNARNFAAGFGFAFNPGDRLLTTSAPLVVPLYAAAWRFMHIPITVASQLASVVAIVTIAVCGYAVVRRFAAPYGALAAVVVFIGSPGITLLWSHETLIWTSLIFAALTALGAGRRNVSAIFMAFALLTRPEGILIAVLVAVWLANKNGIRVAGIFMAISLLPFILWSVYARESYGSFVSHSALAKHSQLLIAGYPYLLGLFASPGHLYRQIDGAWANSVFACALGVIALSYRTAWRQPAVVFATLWCLLTTLSYALIGTHYFVWYGLQIPAMLALSVAIAWPRSSFRSRNVTSLRMARVLAGFIVFIHAVTLVRMVAFPQTRYNIDDDLVMARLNKNAYHDLGRWFAARSRPNDSIAFTEIGQLAYYSHRRIIDTMGLASAGVPEHLAQGNGLWAYERYRPTYIVEETAEGYATLDPREADWFSNAYVLDRRLTLRDPAFPDPSHDTFIIDRLMHASAVPRPGETDGVARETMRVSDGSGSGSIHATFMATQYAERRLEVRLTRSRCVRGSLEIRAISTSRSVVRRFALVNVVERITLALPVNSGDYFELTVLGCSTRALAPDALRRNPFAPFAALEPSRGALEEAITIFDLPKY